MLISFEIIGTDISFLEIPDLSKSNSYNFFLNSLTSLLQEGILIPCFYCSKYSNIKGQSGIRESCISRKYLSSS